MLKAKLEGRSDEDFRNYAIRLFVSIVIGLSITAGTCYYAYTRWGGAGAENTVKIKVERQGDMPYVPVEPRR